MPKLKCISLYQPYATLCVIGAKRFETRSWDTNYRGTVGIHATKSIPIWCKELYGTDPFLTDLKGYALTTGAVVGTVDIVNVVTTERWLKERTAGSGMTQDAYRDYCYGDYRPGRFAWELANPVLYDNPIPAKGSQGFWFLNL